MGPGPWEVWQHASRWPEESGDASEKGARDNAPGGGTHETVEGRTQEATMVLRQPDVVQRVLREEPGQTDQIP